MYDAIHIIGASKTAVFSYLVPISGLLLSIIIFEEIIILSDVIGASLAIIGVVLTKKKLTN